MLGTGTPISDPTRSGPALAVVVNGSSYLVDAGPGVVRRAAAASQSGIPALANPKLDIVFLTHLHSDHTLGLPDLLLSPWVEGRAAPLRVFGPPGTNSMLEHLEAAYSQDVDIRLHGGEPSNKTGWRFTAVEVKPGLVYQDSNVTVSAFRVSHGKWPSAFGYTFKTRDRTIVVSGDTGPNEEIVRQCNGCDVLVHEVYSTAGFATRPPERKAYHSVYHTSSTQLAALATRAKPKLLVLYHQLFWGTSDADLLKEVASGYAGRVVSAADLGVY
jgi:ribonuclease BN (tRNA processing enzyme)